jgi:hypothetical protein
MECVVFVVDLRHITNAADIVARENVFCMSEHKLLYDSYKDRDKYHSCDPQMEFVHIVICFQEYSIPMNKAACSTMPTTTIAVSIFIAAALIAFPMASTGKVAFAVGQTKNMSSMYQQP